MESLRPTLVDQGTLKMEVPLQSVDKSRTAEVNEIDDEVRVNNGSPNRTCTCKKGVNTCAYHFKGITCQTEDTEIRERRRNSSASTQKNIQMSLS